MGITIRKGGLQSLIKDGGRPGYRDSGVPLSGVLDPYRYYWVNKMLGNHAEDPVIEMKVTGVEVYFDGAHIFALTGTEASATLDGKALRIFKTYSARKGQVLKIGRIHNNGTLFLGIRGTWSLQKSLGSYSADLLTPIQGLLGRALLPGDRIEISDSGPSEYIRKECPEEIKIVKRQDVEVIRVLNGPEGCLVKNDERDNLTKNPVSISKTSNRMGLRLESLYPVLKKNKSMTSSFVQPGTVQASSDRNLILLLNHGQTVGGYPRIAQVIKADMYKLAYLGPGNGILFKWTTLEEAKYIDEYQERQFILLSKYFFE